MESTTSTQGVDLDRGQTAYPGIALALAILSVPGSTVTWDALPGGGFAFGFPPALAAIYLGLQARKTDEGRGKATAAIVIAGAMLAMMVVWTIVESI